MFRREDWKYVISAILVATLAIVVVVNFHFSKSRGISMTPTVRENAVIFVLHNRFFFPVNLTGTIVIYWSPQINHTIMHRVIYDNGTHIQAKGDNNPIPDPWYVPKDDVIAIVMFWF